MKCPSSLIHFALPLTILSACSTIPKSSETLPPPPFTSPQAPLIMSPTWVPGWAAFVQSHLTPKLMKAPFSDLCPSGMVSAQKFYAALVKSIVYAESSYKPETVYQEKFPDSAGNRQLSVGLLQLSLDDAKKGTPYCKQMKALTDLKDPEKNLGCGLEIMDRLVGTRASLQESLGRYWSTIRAGHPAAAKLKAELPECYR